MKINLGSGGVEGAVCFGENSSWVEALVDRHRAIRIRCEPEGCGSRLIFVGAALLRPVWTRPKRLTEFPKSYHDHDYIYLNLYCNIWHPTRWLVRLYSDHHCHESWSMPLSSHISAISFCTAALSILIPNLYQKQHICGACVELCGNCSVSFLSPQNPRWQPIHEKVFDFHINGTIEHAK